MSTDTLSRRLVVEGFTPVAWADSTGRWNYRVPTATGMAEVYQDSLGQWRVVTPLTDRTGSVVALVNDSGRVLARYNWGPYGELEDYQGERQTDWGIYGKEWVPEMGLVQMGMRWYSPEDGQFLTEDPLGQFWNPFAYTGGDPLMMADPSGLEAPYDRMNPGGSVIDEGTHMDLGTGYIIVPTSSGGINTSSIGLGIDRTSVSLKGVISPRILTEISKEMAQKQELTQAACSGDEMAMMQLGRLIPGGGDQVMLLSFVPILRSVGAGGLVVREAALVRFGIQRASMSARAEIMSVATNASIQYSKTFALSQSQVAKAGASVMGLGAMVGGSVEYFGLDPAGTIGLVLEGTSEIPIAGYIADGYDMGATALQTVILGTSALSQLKSWPVSRKPDLPLRGTSPADATKVRP